MDSLALAYWLQPEAAITIDYGQVPAEAEIAASTEICRTLGIDHEVVVVDCSSLGSGDMAGRAPNTLAPESEWWPFRNQLLITLAAMKAVAISADRLLIGTVASDDSHADGRPEFVERMRAVLAYQEGGLVVEAPAIHMTTVQLIGRAKVPASLLAWAHSCHKAAVPCGACRGCNKYFGVLRELPDAVA